MKYFLTVVLFIWSLPALANPAFVGVWSWAAFQCRNSNLETESGRSVVWNVQGLDPSTAKITMRSNKTAGFTYCCDENGDKREETGTYTVNDQTHVQLGDDQGGFSGRLINGALIIYGDQNGIDIEDNDTCNPDEKLVFVFDRVD